MNNILLTFSMFMGIPLLMINSPLPMGLILLIQTLLITLITGMMSFTFWYSYILFLIMIGGMLILFIYISSVAPNQMYLFSMYKFYLVLSSLIMLSLYMYKQNNMNSFFFNNNEMMVLMNMELEQNYILKMSLNKLYNKPTNLMMLILINYLLLTLLIVVKITNINMGSLRSKN